MLKQLGFVKTSARRKKPYMSETAKDISAGLTAGAVSTVTVFPLDTLTTRAQARYFQIGKRYKGMEAAKRMWKGLPLTQRFKPGTKFKQFAALYKGLPFKLMKAVPGTAVTLGTYGLAKRFLNERFTSKQ
jgi:murein L,D-transpeptidase YcbB/YkuD